MENNQENGVKEEVEVKGEVLAEQNQVAETSATDNPQPQQTEMDDNQALGEIENILKELPPEEVLKYQRELSVELKQNLFQGEIGELFKKYKPTRKEVQAGAEIIQKSKSAQDKQPQAKEPEAEIDLKQELLKSKIELELVKQGVSTELLEEATIVAGTKIKDLSQLDICKQIAAKFAGLRVAPNAPTERTGIEIGGGNKEMSDGEKAIAFLKKKFPNGYK